MKERNEEEQVEERFVSLYEVRFWGEAAQSLEGTRVEVLGRSLSDGTEAELRYSDLGIRITGDVDQLQSKMEELRSREIEAEADEIPDQYIPRV
ncbi:hypothetical protein IID22_00075 [Patescibacteria group bacterium]|nr:hypothetical protein [Patescibacteria group bacterium]